MAEWIPVVAPIAAAVFGAIFSGSAKVVKALVKGRNQQPLYWNVYEYNYSGGDYYKTSEYLYDNGYTHMTTEYMPTSSSGSYYHYY